MRTIGEVPVEQVAAQVAAQLPKGVFLCAGEKTPNVMTIGWGGLTYYWVRDVFVAPVREIRHTYPLLTEGGAFTISVPHPGTMGKELGLAGTLSGRDGDKFAAIGLPVKKARTLDLPVIDGCALYLECRVRATNAFTAKQTDQEIIDYTYQTGAYHVLFYGEVVACYAGT